MKKLITFFILVMACTQLFAAPIKKIIFFGDSLSDKGKLYSYSDQSFPKSPPYFKGRFSNGHVWSEVIAKNLKTHFNIESENYAVGGATVLIPNFLEGNVPGTLKEEVRDYLDKTPLEKNKRDGLLFTIWMGANDYLAEVIDNNHVNNDSEIDAISDSIVNEIVANIRVLINEGGEHFLVIDLPDLSKLPRVLQNQGNRDTATPLRLLSEKHSAKLANAMRALQNEYPSVDFYFVSAYQLFNDLVIDLEKSNTKYHTQFTNKTQSCWQGGYFLQKTTMTLKDSDVHGLAKAILHSPSLSEAYRVSQIKEQIKKTDDSCNDYIFWDEIHPTKVVHRIFASVIEKELASHTNTFPGK